MFGDLDFPSEEQKRVPTFDWARVKDEHFMQCYREDDALVECVGTYVQQAVTEGGVAIVVATGEHRDGVAAFLKLKGLDAIDLQRSGRYIVLDAARTLDRISVDGKPDSRKFFEVIGLLVSRASNSWGRVRIFGEMVNVLWQEGKKAEAVQLERYWNDLARIYPFALFCAYSKDAFDDDGGCFAEVCEAHSTVIL